MAKSVYNIGEKVFVASTNSVGFVHGWITVDCGTHHRTWYSIYSFNACPNVFDFDEYDIMPMSQAPAFSQTANVTPKPISPLFAKGDRVFVITSIMGSVSFANQARPGKITNVFPPHGTIPGYSYMIDLDTGGYAAAYEYDIVAQPSLAAVPPFLNYTGIPPEAVDWAKGFEPVAKSCECGKEKHGFANHSTWCPKHD